MGTTSHAPARYDLQVHTDASPCSTMAPDALVAAALLSGLDGIVVTDHDTTANVAAVRDRAPAALEVISGVEVTTTQGHLLALGLEEPPVDPPADPLAAVDAVHDRGGYAVLSHPFDGFRQRYDADLAALADRVDGVETTNSRCVLPRFNRRARRFAREHDLPTTGGSDAHFPMEVGRAYTVTDGPLLESLSRGTVRSVGRGGYLSGHVATKTHQLTGWLPG